MKDDLVENAKKKVRKASKLQQHQIMNILYPSTAGRANDIFETCSTSEEPPIDGYPEAMLLKLCPDDPPYLLECFWATRLRQDDVDWVFQLFKKNMRDLYMKSLWGYDESAKERELSATTARFLIIRARIHNSPSCPSTSSSQENTILPVAYAHFRFVEDDSRPVLYCYELQVEKDYHRRGLGTKLVHLMELLGKSTKMDVLMCTVFAYNESSAAFFRGVGFNNDRTCLYGKDRSGGCIGRDYLVLSKSLLQDTRSAGGGVELEKAGTSTSAENMESKRM